MNPMKIFILLALFASVACGPGGHLVLQNKTPYDFELLLNSSIQMDHWTFPETIKANSEAKIYIEFCHNIFSWSWRLDQGTAVYRLKSVGLKFMIRATHVANGGSDMDVLVTFLNFANMEYKVSRNNWKHDEVVVFDLAYDRESGKFYSMKINREQGVPMSARVKF